MWTCCDGAAKSSDVSPKQVFIGVWYHKLHNSRDLPALAGLVASLCNKPWTISWSFLTVLLFSPTLAFLDCRLRQQSDSANNAFGTIDAIRAAVNDNNLKICIIGQPNCANGELRQVSLNITSYVCQWIFRINLQSHPSASGMNKYKRWANNCQQIDVHMKHLRKSWLSTQGDHTWPVMGLSNKPSQMLMWL